jgi:hypothetical protein
MDSVDSSKIGPGGVTPIMALAQAEPDVETGSAGAAWTTAVVIGLGLLLLLASSQRGEVS